MLALATSSGSIVDVVRPARRRAGEVDGAVAATAAARRGRGRLGGRPQAGLGQVGGVREPGGLADDDPDAGAAVAPGAELLDLAVVEQGRRGPLVLDEHLGELAPGPHGRAEDALRISRLDHGRRSWPCESAWSEGAYRTPVPPEPGLAAEVDLTVADADTAVAMRSGEVPVLATPRVVALCEEASVKAIAGRLVARQTSVGMRVQLDHLAPTASATGRAPRPRSSGSRAAASRSPSRVNDERGLSPPASVTRVIVDIERFLDKAR